MKNKLHDLFIDQLQDMYDSEHRQAEAISMKVEAAESEDLKADFRVHLEETKIQIERLKQVFELWEMQPKRNTCHATKGLNKESEELIADFKNTVAADAAIICAGQKVEHYEIATYGCLIAWAEQLGYDNAIGLLEQNLNEEKRSDENLTNAAVLAANLTANV